MSKRPIPPPPTRYGERSGVQSKALPRTAGAVHAPPPTRFAVSTALQPQTSGIPARPPPPPTRFGPSGSVQAKAATPGQHGSTPPPIVWSSGKTPPLQARLAIPPRPWQGTIQRMDVLDSPVSMAEHQAFTQFQTIAAGLAQKGKPIRLDTMMGDLYEGIALRRVVEIAQAEPIPADVLANPVLKITSKKGTLLPKAWGELDFIIVRPAAAATVFSAKTNPKNVSPGTDRGHLAYWELLSAALLGGMTVPDAFREAYKDMKILPGCPDDYQDVAVNYTRYPAGTEETVSLPTFLAGLHTSAAAIEVRGIAPGSVSTERTEAFLTRDTLEGMAVAALSKGIPLKQLVASLPDDVLKRHKLM